MSNNDQETKRPSHIAYQVREGDENKSYFNRIGSVWPHKDGEGYNIQLDAVQVDGRITVRTVQERIQEAKENAREDREDRGGDRRSETNRSNRGDRQSRDTGPRYER